MAKAVSHLDVYIEQPCVNFKECLIVREHTDLPLVLDENVTDLHSLMDVWCHGASDVVNIKISKFGGITKAKKVSFQTNHKSRIHF